MTTDQTITIPPAEYSAEEFQRMADGYTNVHLSRGVTIYRTKEGTTIKWPTPSSREPSPIWAKDWRKK